MRIPVKSISIPADSDQESERSDAGVVIVEEVIGIVKQEAKLSGAKRRLGLAGIGGAGQRGSRPFAPVPSM
jgi:hypothetical protein